jgi:hypothetical protein
MLRPYEYLFYRIYRCQLFVWAEADTAQYRALVAISLLLVFNVYTIGNLVLRALGIANFKSIGWTALDALFVYFGLLAVNYFLLIRSKKTSRLKKEFKGESQNVRRRNGILCLLYCVVTPLAFFATLLPR